MTHEEIFDDPRTAGLFSDLNDVSGGALEHVLEHAFLHVYHEDHANAAMHCADVRYSPLTFRLAEMLTLRSPGYREASTEISTVISHAGAYAEDPGR